MTLTTYATAYLGNIATSIGFAAGDYTVITEETLDKLGLSAEPATLSIGDKAVCRMECWKRVITLLALDYNFSADGASYSRQQMFEMALKNYGIAEAEAFPYLVDNQISVTEYEDNENPYTYNDDTSS